MNPLDALLDPDHWWRGALVHSLLQQRLPLTELAPGHSVGAFRIVRELGRGGMGIVYLAARADGEYEQDVAIKWLPSGTLEPERLEQFRRERQILAHLNHPHIARLLDGGHSSDGHLWFAMERVEGLPVDHHAAMIRLGWRERVRLLLPVMEALQFAHGRLLVHRDIKPGNVLVDRDGRAKLVDFGVAALLSDAHPQHAFTPGYASPEQLAGALPDVASDVWQLGRLLQVVLQAHDTGHTAPRIPHDLAAVVVRATEPDLARRYPTAAALISDLQRVLSFRPVAARRASLAHRMSLVAQRHPLTVLGAALASAAFVAVIGGFMLHLAHERDVAERERAVAAAVNAFLNDDLLPATDPLQGGSHDVAVSELLANALDKVETRLRDLPQVAGEVDLSLGRSLSNLGRFELAHVAFDRAVQRLGEALGPQDPRVLRARLLREGDNIEVARQQSAEQRLQALRNDVLRFGAPASLLVDVDNLLADAAFTREDFALCVQRYAALLPQLDVASLATQSEIYKGLSQCEARRGHFAPSLQHALQSRALRVRDVGAEHPLTLETGLAIETALTGLGRYDEAIAELSDLNTTFSRRYGEAHPTTLTVTHDLGFALICAGRAEEGATWLRRVIAVRTRTLGSDHPWLALSQSVLAMALIRSGQLRDATASLQQAEASLLTHPDGNPFARAIVLENRADLALAQQAPDAVARFDAALNVAAALYAPDHPRLAILRLGRGLAMVQRGDLTQGRALLEHSLALLGNRADCRANQVADARRWLAQQ